MTKPAPATLKIRMHPRTRELIEESARERGNSLNTEILLRLDQSFSSRQTAVDISNAAERVGIAMTALSPIQRDILDLIDKLQQSEHQGLAIKILRDLSPVQETIYSAMQALLPTSDQEQEK